jgi:hypothetical protein
MSTVSIDPAETGLEVLDLLSDAAFMGRGSRERDVGRQMQGMQRLAHAFVEQPETILQELVNAAVDLCGAESAGISLEVEGGTDQQYYQWVATAGQYAGFLNAMLPRFPSACGTCLERGRPQLFRVTQKFFDLMGVTAPTVREGILIPWQVEATRGTIWCMAHERDDAFDSEDWQMMETLADFAAMGVRQQRQQKLLRDRAAAQAAAEMANELAHQINNPLQSLTNLVYLETLDERGAAAERGEQMRENVERLGGLVRALLALRV